MAQLDALAKVLIATQSSAPKDDLAVVDAGLDKHNLAAAPSLADVTALHVVARDASGGVMGGAIGRTWGQCCELQQLWVQPALRAQGLGSRLMAAFEQGALARGCTLVYLETFSFQALAFYQQLAYVEVLRIEGYSGGVTKHSLQKYLALEGESRLASHVKAHP